VLNAKSLGKDQTKKRKNIVEATEDKGMAGVLRRKNTEDDVPLKGEGIVTPPF
jgi:hypothetical protein